jgi:hypothetical protein
MARIFPIPGAVRAALAAGWLLSCASCSDPVTQPFPFSHKVHADNEIECTACHQHPLTQTISGLPTVKDCLDCHDEPQGEGAAEEQFRTMAKALVDEGKPLVWNRLFHVPDHVYYSHRRHVVLGNVPCKSCHGTMGESASPPSSPPVDITMDFCISCHEDKQVPTDCVTCHR